MLPFEGCRVYRKHIAVCLLPVCWCSLVNEHRETAKLATGRSLAYVKEKLTIITKLKGVLARLPKLTLTKHTLIDFMEMDELW